MMNVGTRATALALLLGVAAATTPAAAAKHHARQNARAQAIDPVDAEGMMTPAREKALRDCSAMANKFVQKDWGVTQGTAMGSCMMQHGQPE